MNENFSLKAGSEFLSAETMTLLNSNLGGMPVWKWLALLGIFILLYFLRVVVRWVLKTIKKAEAYFPDKSFMAFFLEEEIEKPLSWIIISTVAIVLLDLLQLSAQISSYTLLLFKIVLVFNVIRACYMAAEAFGLSLQEWAKTTETPFDDQLAPFASKTLKVVVIVIGILVALQNFGVNVTALLAGLGIGGIALAFAAQDTVANVFGTVTILLDNPFKLGDHIKIGDTEGFVEDVGFRSTNIRTFYNSVVSIPNSVVAKERIDNMTKRNGWIRFRHIIGFTYDATPQQLQAFAENLRYQLLQDPVIDRERIIINFNSYGDSSLNMLLQFHFNVSSGSSDPEKTEEYLGLIHQIAAENGLDFAFPTRTLLVQNVIQPNAAEPLAPLIPETTHEPQ